MKNKNILQESLSKGLAIAVIASALYFVYSVFALDLLSTKYLIALFTLLGLVIVFGVRWLLKNQYSNFNKTLAFIAIVGLIVGSGYISKMTKVISQITGAEIETHRVHVLVMNDSAYESMDDLKDKSIEYGLNYKFDKTNLEKAEERLTEDGFDFSTKDYDNYFALIDDLYNNKLEAILINEAHFAFLEDHKPSLEEETRILTTYDFDEVVEKDETHEVDVLKDTFSVFVTGIDTYGPISSVSRSDVNMIMTVNPTTKQILLTSIPRDYHVTLHSFNHKDKLTHAGIYGVNESVRTLEDLLTNSVDKKVDIDYYLKVNFTSVENIVNALGGVSVYSQYDFSAGGYHFNKGYNDMDGKKALRFTRERYNLPGGDFSRIQNQQALITGVINKALSPAIITNYSSFLNSIGSGFELSMSDKDLNRLIRKQIDTMDSWEILQIQMKGTGTSSTNTYSMPGWNLYVAEPNMDTVRRAANLILEMEAGNRISLD